MPWDPSDLLLQEAKRSQKKMEEGEGQPGTPLSMQRYLAVCSRRWRAERGQAGRGLALARSPATQSRCVVHSDFNQIRRLL